MIDLIKEFNFIDIFFLSEILLYFLYININFENP